MRHPCLALAAAGLFLTTSGPDSVRGEERPGIQGVRHQVNLSIKLDPASPLSQGASGQPLKATLTVAVLISDQALGSSFVGIVPGKISDFDPIKGSTEQKIWSDTICHPERGTPKVTALNVDGSITDGTTPISVSSRFRKLGLLVPSDEVTPGRSLPGGVDQIGPFIATRAETKKTRLFLELKLYALPCDFRAKE